MSVAIVSGSAGLVGAACVRLFAAFGLDVVGIDNDLRRSFFGPSASTSGMRDRLRRELPTYHHHECDIRTRNAIQQLFRRFGAATTAVIHTAGQPSHDWSATNPHYDFSVNAVGTLNLLEATRLHCPSAAFVFTSTNKVYGDRINSLPMQESETRWELDPSHAYSACGVPESMSLDQTMHSPFGASKLAADILVQEYGRYFGLPTGVFRAGCITGCDHAAAELHGFLAYLVRTAVAHKPYTVYGYNGKQVRDILHAADMATAIWEFACAPRIGEVYNLGGGRTSSCSVREAVSMIEGILGRAFTVSYVDTPRRGDHKWWISDTRKFERHYPRWHRRHDLSSIVQGLCDGVA
jgi:CDP-paratose 2-epimerase